MYHISYDKYKNTNLDLTTYKKLAISINTYLLGIYFKCPTMVEI